MRYEYFEEVEAPREGEAGAGGEAEAGAEAEIDAGRGQEEAVEQAAEKGDIEEVNSLVDQGTIANAEALSKSNVSGVKDVETELSKLGGDKPYGFTKDSTGKLQPDPSVSPKEVEVNSDGVADVQGLLQDFKSKEENINNEINRRGITETEQTALVKFFKGIAESNDKAYGAPEMPKDVEGILSKNPDEFTADDNAKVNKYLKELKEWSETKETAKLKELNAKNVIEGKKTNRALSNKTIRVLLKLMLVAGSLGTLLYLLQSYSNANSGCMAIYKLTDDDLETQEKIYCENNITFAPQQCYCKNPDDFQIGAPTGGNCNSSLSEPRPAQTFKSNSTKICVGDITTGQTPYLYYSYKVMTPLGAVLDVANRGVGVVTQGLSDILKNIVIPLAIVIGVLILLFIVYKLVSKYRPKNNIENAFGSYSKMGRCRLN